MVKSVYVGPGCGVVTGFATEWRSVGALASHTVLEFPVVRIGVAGGAAGVGKAKRQNIVGTMRLADSVAVRTWHGGMGTGKGKTRVAMHGDRVQRTVKIGGCVASFATIVEWPCRELIVVHVLVTVGAVGELNFVLCFFTVWRVALGALDDDVLALQRIL
jgi:hypothetical protein